MLMARDGKEGEECRKESQGERFGKGREKGGCEEGDVEMENRKGRRGM